ncbi:complex I subunit 5 family protein [Thermococcus waiotapuensis]|uniref:Complex I subunit 5 family protein n=1 Tax=Thermococcus waiotapuensis TaxID=90909 RepID=A0AAE4T149_9EURY|nr:complex I subunit 5 family protein [Thermococcus waiotapuensis]MDV3103880.1 complex I subunit 5 family protein [Thermococcus waiotapuensis]
MEPLTMLNLAVALLFMGALVALFGGGRIAYFFTFSASLSIFLTSKAGIDGFEGEILPFLPTSVNVDSLSALFLMVLAFLSFALSLYLLDYKLGGGERYLGLSVNMALLSALLFLTTDDLERLTLAYEIFAVFTFVLILTSEMKDPKTAAWRYIVLTQLFGITPLLTATSLAHAAGALTLEELRENFANLPLGLGVMHTLYLSAFLVRAGVFPFHTWVVRTYSSIPSPLIPVFIIGEGLGFYGLLRMTEFVLPASRTAGYIIATLGAVSAFATLYSFREIRMKRKFAHHSIMDVGIAFFALGASMVLGGTAGAIILIGALLHISYQAIYKSAIFFGLGAIEHYGEEPNVCSIRKLLRGHVISFLISLSAFSMAGVPPLAAFVSKWPILEGIAMSGDILLWLMMLTVTFLSLFPMASILQIRRLNRELCKREVERGEIPLMIRTVTGAVAIAGFVVSVFPPLLYPWLASAVRGINGSVPESPFEVFFTSPPFVLAVVLLVAAPVAGWRVGRVPTDRVSELLLIFYNAGDILKEAFGFFLDWFRKAYIHYVLPVIKVIPKHELPLVEDVDDAYDYPLRHLDEAMFMPLIRAIERLALWDKSRNPDMNVLISGFAIAMALLIVLLGVFA